MQTKFQIVAVFLALLMAVQDVRSLATAPVLPDGTPIRLRLNRNLSSADARVGETVDFEVLEEVDVNGVVLISKGAVALATVTEAKPKGRMGKAGKLNVNIDHVRLTNGGKAALRAVREGEGGSSTGEMTGAIVATSIVFFPAAPLFLFMKGKDISIPKGTEITAYINGDVRLDESRFHRAMAAPPAEPAPRTAAAAAPGRSLTNEDVIQLKHAGLSDEIVIGKIRSAPAQFRTDTVDLIELKKAGVSDGVISAMVGK